MGAPGVAVMDATLGLPCEARRPAVVPIAAAPITIAPTNRGEWCLALEAPVFVALLDLACVAGAASLSVSVDNGFSAPGWAIEADGTAPGTNLGEFQAHLGQSIPVISRAIAETVLERWSKDHLDLRQ